MPDIPDARNVAIVCGSLLLMAACNSSPTRPLGEVCVYSAQCASGLCSGPGGVCTVPCSTSADCPSLSPTERTICRPDSVCALPCDAGEVLDTGASTALCVDGSFVPCDALDPADVCDRCGCAVFGGGRCVEGAGCIPPLADGASCTLDEECASGACYRDGGICGPRREMGAPCRADAECTTGNCSNDGEDFEGVCNQPLGSPCSPGGRTETCRYCLGGITGFDGICSRDFCDPVDAPNCPRVHPHRWTCRDPGDGRHRCLELCAGAEGSYRCYLATESCRPAGFCD